MESDTGSGVYLRFMFDEVELRLLRGEIDGVVEVVPVLGRHVFALACRCFLSFEFARYVFGHLVFCEVVPVLPSCLDQCS